MMKINNKKITNSLISGLGILAILALGVLVMPMKTDAATTGGGYGNNTNYNSYIRNYGTTERDPNAEGWYYSNAGSSNNTAVNYYNGGYGTPNNNSGLSNNTVVTPVVTPVPTIYSDSSAGNTASSNVAVKTTSSTKVATVSKTTDNSSNLAANAVFGENSFMPSSLIEWIIFAILVLLIVILVRKVFDLDKNYHSTPLKHK